jgi:hypothetical protein
MTSPRQKQLEEQGWERKTTTDEPRLGELVELYRSIGFEVHLEPFVPGDEACSECMAAEPERFKTIYIRPK